MGAYGDADTAGTPMTTRMHYRIASVTKTFTATAILQLIDRGKVGLDQPTGDFVPRIPNGSKVTIRDLLAMRSGLYDYSSDPAIRGLPEGPASARYSLARPLTVLGAHAGECTPPDRKQAGPRRDRIQPTLSLDLRGDDLDRPRHARYAPELGTGERRGDGERRRRRRSPRPQTVG
jgi:CubicO group peptidase (beta-lactamase class C family)